MAHNLMGTINSKQSQMLIDPYIKVTIGKLGEQAGDTFTIGDGKLIKASVTLGEGKVQSSCSFTVLDADRSLVDKYFTYVEKVGGLDTVEAPSTAQNTNVNSISNPVIDASDKSGRVIFESTKASLFNDRVGSRGNRLDPDNVLGCAMRYNNPSAAGQFGSAGMIDYLKFGDKVKVTNLDNNRSIICEIQDWGPNPRLLRLR